MAPNFAQTLTLMYSFLVADEHCIIRTGVCAILSAAFPSAVIARARSAAEIKDIYTQGRFHLVVMDINFEDGNGMDVMEWLLHQNPDQTLLMLSMMPPDIYARRAFGIGARAFLPKSTSEEELVTTVNQLLNGKIILTEDVTRMLTSDLLLNRSDNPFLDLSHREMEVLKHLLTGMSIQQISKEMNLRRSTIGTYKVRILAKTGARNMIELADLAKTHRLSSIITPEEMTD